MMQLVQIIALSIMVGVVAAGFVWYTWTLVEIVRPKLRASRNATGATEKGAPGDGETPAA